MKMAGLVFIVEGDTEVNFVKGQIIPYLCKRYGGIPMNAQKITTNRKKRVKGGNVGFEYLKNEVKRVAAARDVLVTTLLDFFRLPSDFPNYTTDKSGVEKIEQGINNELAGTVATDRFLPYIQLHEIEALMFIKIEGFKLLIDENRQRQQLQSIIEAYRNPEDINGGADTAPSKRLKNIFPNYSKVISSELVFENLDIDEIRAKCPRFREWLSRVEYALDHGSFVR